MGIVQEVVVRVDEGGVLFQCMQHPSGLEILLTEDEISNPCPFLCLMQHEGKEGFQVGRLLRPEHSRPLIFERNRDLAKVEGTR